MKYINSEHLPKRLALALLFGLIFSIMGKIIPESYYRYLDNTPYLIVDSPVNVDRTYFKPCDKVILTTSLSALVDVDAMILNQLVLVKDDGTEFQLPESLVQLRTPIRKTEPHTVSYPYPLPCDLSDGRYFWKGTITYSHRDVQKTIGFISQTFNVTQSGLSPAGEQLIQEKLEDEK